MRERCDMSIQRFSDLQDAMHLTHSVVAVPHTLNRTLKASSIVQHRKDESQLLFCFQDQADRVFCVTPRCAGQAFGMYCGVPARAQRFRTHSLMPDSNARRT